MSAALARGNGYLTVGDVLMLELPHLSREDAQLVLWECTGWPCFWSGDGHIVNELRAQLAEFRAGRPHAA